MELKKKQKKTDGCGRGKRPEIEKIKKRRK